MIEALAPECSDDSSAVLDAAGLESRVEIEAFASLFAAAGLRTATFPNDRAMKWSKLLLNIQANALPAILDVSPGQVFAVLP